LLDKALVAEVLARALCTGGDFAEVFAEDTYRNGLIMTQDRMDEAATGRDYGIGIRIFKELRCIYAYTNDGSREGLLKLAGEAATALGAAGTDGVISLKPVPIANIHPVKAIPSSTTHQKRVALIKQGYAVMKENPEVVQIIVRYSDEDQKVMIANSNGLYCEDRRIRSRMFFQAIASDGKENQVGFEGPGGLGGIELFTERFDIEPLARDAAQMAVTMLHAEECPAGRMPVIIDNGFGGVLFHEACGHSLEATGVAKGQSEFSGKLHQRIASDVVSAIDDGTMPGEWGSLNIDDEGIPTQNKLLIDKGILNCYMIDSFNGRRMEMAPTGSSRRQSYKYCPTSRMTNTYICAGSDENDAIIGATAYGLYAKKMGGGSVNPLTGEFNFAVGEGYIIKNGKIDHPVRGASLIGKGGEVLMTIDMVGKHMTMGQGMCGSMSGSVPTNVGQPMIRVSELTVGGR